VASPDDIALIHIDAPYGITADEVVSAEIVLSPFGNDIPSDGIFFVVGMPKAWERGFVTYNTL
jgi:hypothetical protein